MKLEKLKQKIQEFAVEVAEHTYNDSRTVIAFTNYTFSVVTGSWEAQNLFGWLLLDYVQRKKFMRHC